MSLKLFRQLRAGAKTKLMSIWTVLMLVAAGAVAQPERIYLHVDKATALPGDTLWCKGYVCRGGRPGGLSTILYVSLFDRAGNCLREARFPITDGYSVGQLALPGGLPAGLYWLRAVTAFQYAVDPKGSWYQPVRVFGTEKGSVVPDRYSYHTGGSSDTSTIVTAGLHWRLSERAGLIDTRIHLDSATVTGNREVSLLLEDENEGEKRYPVKLSAAHPDFHLRILLEGVLGPFYVSVETQDSVLAKRELYIRYHPTIDVQLKTDSLDTRAAGWNSWQVNINDSLVTNWSVSVTDADRVDSMPASICELPIPRNLAPHRHGIQIDSAALELKGQIVGKDGRPVIGQAVGGRQLVLTIAGDSSHQTVLAPVDSTGRFALTHLSFWDTADVSYRWKDTLAGDTALRVEWARQPQMGFDVPQAYQLSAAILSGRDSLQLFAGRIYRRKQEGGEGGVLSAAGRKGGIYPAASDTTSRPVFQLPGYSRTWPFSPQGDGRWTLFWMPVVEADRVRIRFRNNSITRRFRIRVEGMDSQGNLFEVDRVVGK
jgi:hypothetical protein